MLFVALILSCSDNHTPKPRGFFKFDFPVKEYSNININCPFSFDTPQYSEVFYHNECLFDIRFPMYKAQLHITYLSLNNDLNYHIEQSRDLAYKHNIMADAITEQVYINEESNVYGILYDYKGMTATSTQFVLTDSSSHFFRGALYFNTEINDSIIPVNNFLKEDIKQLIESFSWKN
jgi:gliding motility-associated lipoprotein GldD